MLVINFRKNRERGRLDPVKEGRLYKRWRDEKDLTQKQIGAKFDVTQAHVSMRIRNVENVDAEAIQVLRERKPSTNGEYKTLYTQPELKESSKLESPEKLPKRETPIEAAKLDLLGSITFARLLKRARPLRGLSEDVPEDIPIIEEIRTRYEKKTKALQLEVAEKIREKSFR